MFRTQYDIFLSYSRQDAASAAPLVEALRARGYNIFYDKKSIVVGEQWKPRLREAIRSSRVSILCWSESARNSEFVTFEYGCAEGMGKPVLPWLLDNTPLPQMIEIQSVTERDSAKAAEEFILRLGRTLSARRRMQVIAAVLATLVLLLAAASTYWRMHLAPPPWEFAGRVVDSETKLPVAGVEVQAQENRFVTHTDSNGAYVFRLPQPKPKYLHLVFAKQGYKAEEPVDVPSDHPFNTDMTRLK